MASVVHFEIPVDDPERAHAFYRAAFGWRIDAMPDMGYALVGTTPADDQGRPAEPGAVNGGMLQRSETVPTVVVTVGVDDIDAALATVESAGGTTVAGRPDVAGMGWSAYDRDSEGNVIGLWQPAP